MLRRLAPALLGLLVAVPARAQQPDPEIPRASRTYAITNARVVVAPGRVLEHATVVVRDGLITGVGASVRAPFDAQVIRGDSLTVYAGFIDALGQAGLPRPQNAGAQRGPGGGGQPQQRVPDPSNPPRDRAGLQPERHASAMLEANDASVDAHRKQGFALVHAVPYGGYLPGQGALVLLGSVRPNTPSGASGLVYRDDASLFTQFQGARGVYPSTPMGIMASWRELYRETARRGTLRQAYAQNPSGRERPVNDPVYDALQPVVGGRMPVFFYAQSALEAHRALLLKRDLGFNLVLAGVPDASEMTDRLKAARVPLLLTLGLPDEPKADTSGRTRRDSVGPIGSFDPGFRVGNFANLAGEKSNLEARVRASATNYTETAARLNREGVRFAFTTMGAKIPDVQKNVRRMIAAGLPEETALAALTTQAADLLGVGGAFGTVEQGKVANLVVTKGSYFAADGQVRYVFVDGDRFDYPPTAAAAGRGAGRRGPNGQTGAAPSVPGVAGRWSFTVTPPGNQGTVGGTLSLTGSPGAPSGSISSEALGTGETLLQNVRLSGNALSFSFDAGQYGTITAAVTIDGDTFSGTLTIPGLGAAPITGTKQP